MIEGLCSFRGRSCDVTMSNLGHFRLINLDKYLDTPVYHLCIICAVRSLSVIVIKPFSLKFRHKAGHVVWCSLNSEATLRVGEYCSSSLTS